MEQHEWITAHHRTRYYGIYVQGDYCVDTGCTRYWITDDNGGDIAISHYPTDEEIDQYRETVFE